MLALGAAVAAAAVLALRVAPWTVRSLSAQHERVTAEAALLARARDDLGQADALVDSGAVLRARIVALAHRILTGSTEAEALADLSGRLGAAAARHRVKVERTDLLRDSTRAGGLRAVRLRASLEGDSRGTLELLRALTAGDVVLEVEEIRIMALDPTSPEGAAEILRTELAVQGWYLEPRPAQ